MSYRLNWALFGKCDEDHCIYIGSQAIFRQLLPLSTSPPKGPLQSRAFNFAFFINISGVYIARKAALRKGDEALKPENSPHNAP